MDKNKIIQKCQKFILDHSKNNIQYSFTLLKDKLLLHIHNPLLEQIKLTDNNSAFFKNVIEMLFERNLKNKEKGCFNHEFSDDNSLYTYNDQELLDYFIKIEYTFIFIDKNFIP